MDIEQGKGKGNNINSKSISLTSSEGGRFDVSNLTKRFAIFCKVGQLEKYTKKGN